MKRVGYIYEKIYDIDNIKRAIMQASKNKRKHRRVQAVLSNMDKRAEAIHEMLKNKTYVPSPYIVRHVYDGGSKKIRKISKPKFYPDQIIHWALMLQIQPILKRGMYKYTCGSVPKRGTSYGRKTIRKWIDTDYKNTKYCLKLDIRKYYQSVDNNQLKALFRRNIKDRDCLWLIDTIVDSNVGLPIGNYTSQWFSNYFLQGLDHYIKEQLKVKHYIRYVDDLVLLGGNKRTLHRARKVIEQYLARMGLKLKDNWQVFKINCRDIDFLGFRFFRNKTILRKRNSLRIRRRVRKIQKKDRLNRKDASAVISYWGWIKHSNSYKFYNTHIKPMVSLNKAKRVVSAYDKAENLRISAGL